MIHRLRPDGLPVCGNARQGTGVRCSRPECSPNPLVCVCPVPVADRHVDFGMCQTCKRKPLSLFSPRVALPRQGIGPASDAGQDGPGFLSVVQGPSDFSGVPVERDAEGDRRRAATGTPGSSSPPLHPLERISVR